MQSYSSHTSTARSSDGAASQTARDLCKRAFVIPALKPEGSVPRITCGSDIFGDNRP